MSIPHRVMESASVQTFRHTWKALIDPTGNTPSYAAVVVGSGTTSPGPFSDGSLVSYSSTTFRAVATTPSFGATGADIETTEHTTYMVYEKVGTEIFPAFTLRVD